MKLSLAHCALVLGIIFTPLGLTYLLTPLGVLPAVMMFEGDTVHEHWENGLHLLAVATGLFVIYFAAKFGR